MLPFFRGPPPYLHVTAVRQRVVFSRKVTPPLFLQLRRNMLAPMHLPISVVVGKFLFPPYDFPPRCASPWSILLSDARHAEFKFGPSLSPSRSCHFVPGAHFWLRSFQLSLLSSRRFCDLAPLRRFHFHYLAFRVFHFSLLPL